MAPMQRASGYLQEGFGTTATSPTLHRHPHQALVYQAARYVIQDLHLQLYQCNIYKDLWEQICSCLLEPLYYEHVAYAPAFICAQYCLLGLCFQDLPDIDQFRCVVLTVLTNDYKIAKELPLSNRIDPNGSDFTIPPLPQNIGTSKGLEDMGNKDIQLHEGQREDQGITYGFQLKKRERGIKELEQIVQGNAAKC